MERFTGGVIGIAEIPLVPLIQSLQKQAQSMKAFGSEPTSQQWCRRRHWLYWTLSGTGIDANDFSAGACKVHVLSNPGTITFAHTANDLSTEGTETLEIKLYSDWARTTQVGDTATVTINDTSVTNPSYYSVSDTQAYEGEGLYVRSAERAMSTCMTSPFPIPTALPSRAMTSPRQPPSVSWLVKAQS